MGHIRLSTLTITRRWKDVIGLVAEGADAPRVAEAVTHAWEHAFETVRNDVGFREAVWLVMQMGVAGRSKDPAEHLSSVGVDLANAQSVAEVGMALSEAMERRIESTRQRSDFGELASRALVSSIAEQFQQSMPTLLESTAADVGPPSGIAGRRRPSGN